MARQAAYSPGWGAVRRCRGERLQLDHVSGHRHPRHHLGRAAPQFQATGSGVQRNGFYGAGEVNTLNAVS
ncbi:MAG TPA: hypothetical protein VII16_06810 [Actinomycetes bacterium]